MVIADLHSEQAKTPEKNVPPDLPLSHIIHNTASILQYLHPWLHSRIFPSRTCSHMTRRCLEGLRHPSLVTAPLPKEMRCSRSKWNCIPAQQLFFASTKSENKHTQRAERTFEREAGLKSFPEALVAALIYTIERYSSPIASC